MSVAGEPKQPIPINVDGSKVVLEITPKIASEPVAVDTVSVIICGEVPSESASPSTSLTSVPPSSSSNVSSPAGSLSAESSPPGEYCKI